MGLPEHGQSRMESKNTRKHKKTHPGNSAHIFIWPLGTVAKTRHQMHLPAFNSEPHLLSALNKTHQKLCQNKMTEETWHKACDTRNTCSWATLGSNPGAVVAVATSWLVVVATSWLVDLAVLASGRVVVLMPRTEAHDDVDDVSCSGLELWKTSAGTMIEQLNQRQALFQGSDPQRKIGFMMFTVVQVWVQVLLLQPTIDSRSYK